MLRTTYQIKQASAGDKERITAFVMRLLRTLYSEGHYNPAPDDLTYFTDFYLIPENACFYIAENEAGQMIGTAAVRPYDGRFPYLEGLIMSGKTCEMARFYIEEGCRRIGIGGALYAAAEDFARQAGFEECYLHTSVFLPGGFPFWTSRGYEERYWETDQIVHMGKLLALQDCRQIL